MNVLLVKLAAWINSIGQAVYSLDLIQAVMLFWLYPIRLIYFIYSAMNGGIVDFAVNLAGGVVLFLWNLLAGNGPTVPTASQVIGHPVTVLVIAILRYIDAFLPVSNLFTAIGFILVFFCICLLIRLLLLVYSLVPVFGRNT